MKTVALILARGGSKGIPKKNIQSVCGRPLISYTIEAAIMGGFETWVSTDDLEIKKVSEKWGSRVLKRPDKFAQDNSPSEEALLHFADNIEFDKLIFIQPTSPLLKSRHLKEGLLMMGEYDSIFSGYKQHWIPKWKECKDKRNLNGENIGTWFEPVLWSKNNRPRRQDRRAENIENGAFYITSKENLLKSKCRYSGRIGMYEMSFSESFQVDSWDDLRIIESILGLYR